MSTSISVNLTAAEQRYCRCLLRLEAGGKIDSPYGVCTNSVFSKKNRKRGRIPPCSENYNFEKSDMGRKNMEAYAKLHKIPASEYKSLTDKQLAAKLSKFVTDKYGSTRRVGSGVGSFSKHKFDAQHPRVNKRNVWIEFVKDYREEHPELSYKQALSRASVEYRSLDN